MTNSTRRSKARPLTEIGGCVKTKNQARNLSSPRYTRTNHSPANGVLLDRGRLRAIICSWPLGEPARDSFRPAGIHPGLFETESIRLRRILPVLPLPALVVGAWGAVCSEPFRVHGGGGRGEMYPTSFRRLLGRVPNPLAVPVLSLFFCLAACAEHLDAKRTKSPRPR